MQPSAVSPPVAIQPAPTFEVFELTNLHSSVQVTGAVEADGTRERWVELVLPPRAVDFSIDLYDVPGVHVRIRGSGAATLMSGAIDVFNAASVEVADMVFSGGPEVPVKASALTHLTLTHLAFLDQHGTRQTTGHGALPFDAVATLNVTAPGGTITVEDVALVGDTGAFPALRMSAPKGTIQLSHVFVADTDRTPFYVGLADSVTLADSVVALPMGTPSLFLQAYPAKRLAITGSTVLVDSASHLLHPGSNPQTNPSMWLPPVVEGCTLFVRSPVTGEAPEADLSAARVLAAPPGTPDPDALRTRAHLLLPYDRAALLELVGLAHP